MYFKSGLTLTVVLFPLLSLFGQVQRNEVLFAKLQEHQSFQGEVLSYNPHGVRAIFWPNEIQQPKNSSDKLDQLIKCNQRIYVLIDSTNRVYEWKKSDDQDTLVRLDRSDFIGQNVHTFKFCFNNSLYSLGGFGFENINGRLHRFDEVTLDWRLQTLPDESPIQNSQPPGFWWDQKEEKIYHIDHHYNELFNLTEDSLPGKVQQLDLREMKWKEVGSAKSRRLSQLLTTAKRIANSEMGQIILIEQKLKKQLALLDYKKNQIRIAESSVVNKLNEIIDLKRNSPMPFEGRFMIWHHKDTLWLFHSSGELNKVSLKDQDFKIINDEIWEADRSYLQKDGFLLIGIFLIGSGMLFLAILVYRKRRNSEKPIVLIQAESLFTRPELEIIQALQKASKKELLTDNINDLLGTSKKTIEVQKKQRSDVIKGINDKYRRLSNTSDNLILQERLEDDRRQVRYLFNMDALDNLKSLVSGI